MAPEKKKIVITPEKRRAVEELAANKELVTKYGKYGRELLFAKSNLRDLRKEYRIEGDVSLNSDVAKQRLSRAYEKVGELYSNVGNLREALKYYHSAEQYAPHENVKERIAGKISALEESMTDILGIEQRAVGYLAIISLSAALLSLSLKWTGSVVGTSSARINWIALVLFLLGGVFLVFYLRAKKKKRGK